MDRRKTSDGRKKPSSSQGGAATSLVGVSGDAAEGNTRQSLGGLTMGSGFSGMLNHLTFGLLGSK